MWIFLLFEVGLSTDFLQLKATGTQCYRVALMGVILPFSFGFVISYMVFHLALFTALFIGSALTATSIGITVRILKDLKLHHSLAAHIVLGAAILDDIIGVLLLAFVYELAAKGHVTFNSIATISTYLILFIVCVPIMTKVIMNLFARRSNMSMLMVLAVGLIFIFAEIANKLGIPAILGSFSMGLALSRQFTLGIPNKRWVPYAKQLNQLFEKNELLAVHLEKQIKPLVAIFTPIFFVMVGISLNLKMTPWHSATIGWFTISLLVLGLLGKLFAGFATRLPIKEKIMIGISMMPRGEVGLIFAQLGLSSQVLTQSIYAGLILIVALTTLLAPILLRTLYAPTL